MSTLPSFFNSQKCKYGYTELKSKVGSKIEVISVTSYGLQPEGRFWRDSLHWIFRAVIPRPSRQGIRLSTLSKEVFQTSI